MNIIKTVFKPLCVALSAVALFISAVPGFFAGTGKAVFTVDASALGDELPNVADNVNVWDMGTQFITQRITPTMTFLNSCAMCSSYSVRAALPSAICLKTRMTLQCSTIMISAVL